jgi:hypothetical protein
MTVYATRYLIIIANMIRKRTLLMNHQASTHRTLILRCWSEQDEQATRRFWRFHLKWLDTEERQSFATVEALLATLDQTFRSEDNRP